MTLLGMEYTLTGVVKLSGRVETRRWRNPFLPDVLDRATLALSHNFSAPPRFPAGVCSDKLRTYVGSLLLEKRGVKQ